MNKVTLTILFTTAYLAIFVQTHLDFTRNWFGTRIDLLPGLVVYTGFRLGLGPAMGLALFGGLCFDSISANPLGVTTLSLLAIGFGAYHYREFILQEQKYAQWVIGSVASALSPALTLILLLGLGMQPAVGWETLLQLFVMAVFGGLVTPCWFLAFDKVDQALSYPAMPESSFRNDREIERGRS